MFKKIRVWFWLVSAFLKRYVLGIIASVVLGFIVFGLADRFWKQIPYAKTIYIGRVGTILTNQLPLDIQTKISKGITKIKINGDYDLDLAEAITISDDGLNYQVKLRSDVKWMDGTSFGVNDVNYSIADVNIDKIDDSTINFKLKSKFAPFPMLLTQPIFRKQRKGFLIKKTVVLGLNEYVLDNLKTEGQYVKLIRLKSNKETLIYYFFNTEEEALIAYKLGKIDRVEGITKPWLNDWNNSIITQNDIKNRYVALFFNTDHPLLADKTIRQMLAYATVKNTDNTRVLSPISKYSWAYNPQVKIYSYNAETAKKMLDQQKNSNPQAIFSFSLTTTPAYTDIAQKIADSWSQIGINVELTVTSVPDLNDYQILLIGQQIPDDPDQYYLWHSTQNTNIAHYRSPKLDKLLEDGRQELDKVKRLEIYQDFQRFLVEDCPAVFLQELPLYQLIRVSRE